MSLTTGVVVVGGLLELLFILLAIWNWRRQEAVHADRRRGAAESTAIAQDSIRRLLEAKEETGRMQGQLEGMPVFWRDDKGERRESVYSPPVVEP